MKRILGVTAVLVLAGVGPVLAQSKDDRREARDDRREERVDRQDRRGDRAERIKKTRKEMELRRTLQIADELGLQETQALQVRDALRVGDDKRLALGQALRTEVAELKRLGKGSPTAKDVEERIRKIQDVRIKLVQADEEMLVAASRGLAPNQKARLAVLMGKHDRQMRFLMMRQMVKRGLGRDAPRADDDGEDDEGGLMFP